MRDATLAAASAIALVATLLVTDSLPLLLRPLSVGVGVVTALAVEGLFVADTPAGDLWERPTVQVGSAVALLSGGALAVATGAVWLVAAACWGLATYFCLLALILTGHWTPDED